jgi:hypothetical protein
MYDDLRHVHALFKKHFCDQCLCLKYVNTQTKHFKSVTHMYTTACYNFPKNLIHWRDSNPGLLFLRRIGSLKKTIQVNEVFQTKNCVFFTHFISGRKKSFTTFRELEKFASEKVGKVFQG